MKLIIASFDSRDYSVRHFDSLIFIFQISFEISFRSFRPSKMSPKFFCIECQKIDFNSKNELKTHLEKEHGLLSMYKCDQCQEPFDKTSLMDHYKDDHGISTLLDCSKLVDKYTKKKNGGGCSFLCSKYDLMAEHLQQIHIVTTQKCDPCKKLFENRSKLNKHNLAIHPKKPKGPFFCRFCSSFSTNHEGSKKKHEQKYH